jgi:hypothetical protein
MFATWPFLWEDPLRNFIGVFRFMSDNPTQLSVLFGGEIYRAGELPRRYLPFMFAATLTEPTWLLFVVGLVDGYWKLIRNRRTDREAFQSRIISLSLALSLLLILFAYVLLRRPAMYDGIRHFLFIVPPVFIFIGLGFQFIIEQINSWIKSPAWLHAGLGILFLIPGWIGIAKLHPYEYAYYNSFVGGTSGVFRMYETEYWLSCYKEAVEELNETIETDINLFVFREAYIAKYYADDNINIYDFRAQIGLVESGDYVLINSRTNEDLPPFPDVPPILEVAKDDAVFCVVIKVP